MFRLLSYAGRSFKPLTRPSTDSLWDSGEAGEKAKLGIVILLIHQVKECQRRLNSHRADTGCIRPASCGSSFPARSPDHWIAFKSPTPPPSRPCCPSSLELWWHQAAGNVGHGRPGAAAVAALARPAPARCSEAPGPDPPRSRPGPAPVPPIRALRGLARTRPTRTHCPFEPRPGLVLSRVGAEPRFSFWAAVHLRSPAAESPHRTSRSLQSGVGANALFPLTDRTGNHWTDLDSGLSIDVISCPP